MAKRREKGDGSIYQRGDGLYVAYARLLSGKRKYVYDKTRSGVAKKLKELQKNIAAGTLITARPETVEAYLWSWLERKTRLKETTHQNYKNAIALAVPHIGAIKLQKLTGDHLHKMYTDLLKNHRTRSVQNTHTILKIAFKDAIKRKKLNSNPCDDVEMPYKPDEKKYEATALTAEQCVKLIEAAKGSNLECLVVFTLATALRRGELIGLRWADISLEEKLIKVQRTASYLPDKTTGKYRYIETTPKSESSQRTIPLTEFAIVALKSHKIRQLEQRLAAGAAWTEKDLVFPGQTGKHFPTTTLNYQFRQIIKQAEIPDICIHELRHSAATLLLKMGVDIKVIQKILGHANYSTTANIYGHVLMDMQQDAMHKMDDLFRKDGTKE